MGASGSIGGQSPDMGRTVPRTPTLQSELIDLAHTIDDEFLAGIVRSSANPYAVIDEAGQVLFVSDPIGDILGLSAEECMGRDIMDFIAPEHREGVAIAVAEFADAERDDAGWTGPPISVDLVRVDGARVPCRVLGVGSGRPGFRGVVVRIRHTATAAKLDNAVTAMITSDELDQVLHLLLDVLCDQLPGSAASVALDWDDAGFAEVVSTADVPRLSGTSLPTTADDGVLPWVTAAVAGAPEAVDIAGLPRHLARVVADGGYSACWCFPIELGGAHENVLVVWRRVPGAPSQHQAEAVERVVQLMQLGFTAHHSRRSLRQQARTDPLTGLANRLALFDRLEELTREGAPIGVLYCDLDDFKPVNDRFGHGTGDQVLTVAANRISSQVRSGDLVARLGGDEFAVLCVGTDAARMAGLARRLVRSFQEPIVVDGQSVTVSISVGSALRDGVAHNSTGSILHEADQALLAAKAGGKGVWRPSSV
ncbi:MAG: diguanylate cyclase [Acidimicrobiia bacterium]|nr:diguanylate cyclase [Acidimicrobiia bacterium]